jgi:hypothetical protein
MNIAILRLAIVTLSVAGLCEVASACSLVRSYEPFRLPTIRYTDPAPAPDVRVADIKRGHSGSTTACANVGSVLVSVPAGDAGYSFEVIESRGPRIVFPAGFVRSSSGYAQPANLRFYWDDGATDAQEPIELRVKVTAMSRDGVFTDPVVLKIEHPGVSAAR